MSPGTTVWVRPPPGQAAAAGGGGGGVVSAAGVAGAGVCRTAGACGPEPRRSPCVQHTGRIPVGLVPATGSLGFASVRSWLACTGRMLCTIAPNKSAFCVLTSNDAANQTRKGPELTCCCCCVLRHTQHLSWDQLVAVEPWVRQLNSPKADPVAPGDVVADVPRRNRVGSISCTAAPAVGGSRWRWRRPWPACTRRCTPRPHTHKRLHVRAGIETQYAGTRSLVADRNAVLDCPPSPPRAKYGTRVRRPNERHPCMPHASPATSYYQLPPTFPCIATYAALLAHSSHNAANSHHRTQPYTQS